MFTITITINAPSLNALKLSRISDNRWASSWLSIKL